MSPIRTLACIYALAAPFFTLTDRTSVVAAEKAATITLRGRVDVAGLDVAAGPFTVRAVRPQTRTVELGKTTTGNNGEFQLTVDQDAVGLYGVTLEAASANNPALVLEAALLRSQDAASPLVINLSSTVETAILNWRIQSHAKDPAFNRPYRLFEWLRPLSDPKARDELKRAQALLAKWALAAAAPASRTTATVLQAAVGDLRLLRKQLSDLRVSPDAIAQVEEMARKDAEVAYILMMPYFLDL
jgi:hypothetical protein